MHKYGLIRLTNSPQVSEVNQLELAHFISTLFQTGEQIAGTDGKILCKNLNIPMCVDRAVYCTYPPDKDVVIKTNPSPIYKSPSGKPKFKVGVRNNLFRESPGRGGGGGLHFLKGVRVIDSRNCLVL